MGPMVKPCPDTAVQDAFREVMANVCTPVSVVTTQSADQPYGTTVSAFASLSMSPPMVIVSLNRESMLLAAVRETRTFGLNILSHRQVGLALNFARKTTTGKFGSIAWQPEAGVPRLAGATGFISCDVADIVSGGDHYIVLGHVVAAAIGAGSPLTYHARSFGTYQPGLPGRWLPRRWHV